MANRHTGSGYYTFVDHRFALLFGAPSSPRSEYAVCIYCGERPRMENEERHCAGKAAQLQREAVRARREEGGLCRT